VFVDVCETALWELRAERKQASFESLDLVRETSWRTLAAAEHVGFEYIQVL